MSSSMDNFAAFRHTTDGSEFRVAPEGGLPVRSGARESGRAPQRDTRRRQDPEFAALSRQPLVGTLCAGGERDV